MKQCVEDIEFLRFKLRMFGIPILNDEPTGILCDNESLVKNSTGINSTLNKRHSAIAYHFVRWAVAASVCKIAWVSTANNIADALTKRLDVRTREFLFNQWTY